MMQLLLEHAVNRQQLNAHVDHRVRLAATRQRTLQRGQPDHDLSIQLPQRPTVRRVLRLDDLDAELPPLVDLLAYDHQPLDRRRPIDRPDLRSPQR